MARSLGSTTRVFGLLVATTATTFAQPVASDPTPDDAGAGAPSADPTPPPAPAPEPVSSTLVTPRAVVSIRPDDVRPREGVAALSPTSGFKDGFILAAGDNSSKMYIGAISQFDGRFFVNSPPTDVDQFAFKTLRIDLRGTIFDHYDFRFPAGLRGQQARGAGRIRRRSLLGRVQDPRRQEQGPVRPRALAERDLDAVRRTRHADAALHRTATSASRCSAR